MGEIERIDALGSCFHSKLTSLTEIKLNISLVETVTNKLLESVSY